MNAKPLLLEVGRALAEAGLEAVLIGNAAAALQGAPVTTIDLDFFFPRTPLKLRKLKAIATRLGAVVLRPYYPVSDLSASCGTRTACSSTSWRRSTASGRSRAFARGPGSW